MEKYSPVLKGSLYFEMFFRKISDKQLSEIFYYRHFSAFPISSSLKKDEGRRLGELELLSPFNTSSIT